MGGPPFFYLYHVLQLLNSPEYHLVVLSDQPYPHGIVRKSRCINSSPVYLEKRITGSKTSKPLDYIKLERGVSMKASLPMLCLKNNIALRTFRWSGWAPLSKRYSCRFHIFLKSCKNPWNFLTSRIFCIVLIKKMQACIRCAATACTVFRFLFKVST